MNKKQSKVAWAMIALIVIAIARMLMVIPNRGFLSIMEFYFSLAAIIILGGLLIYTLRDKKK